MNDIKYISLDFDGTILNSKGQVSNNLVNKLIELQEREFKVILCSGRSLFGVMDVAKKINLSKYEGFISCYNGAEIFKYENNTLKKIKNINFTKEEVKDIVDIIGDEVKCITTYHEKTMGVSNIVPEVERSSKIMGLKLSGNLIQDTPKILILDEKEKIIQIKGDIKNKINDYDPSINVFSSVEHIIEITPKNAQKGNSLALISKLDKAGPENFICFGDNENDISMFEFCKYSVATGNAIDELKAISSYITLSNNEDGVYEFLKNKF